LPPEARKVNQNSHNWIIAKLNDEKSCAVCSMICLMFTLGYGLTVTAV